MHAQGQSSILAVHEKVEGRIYEWGKLKQK